MHRNRRELWSFFFFFPFVLFALALLVQSLAVTTAKSSPPQDEERTLPTTSSAAVCEHVADRATSSSAASSVCHTTAAPTIRTVVNNNTAIPRIPPTCQLVMAESSLPNAGWGMYTLTLRSRGDALLPGDSVVQVVDLNETTALGMRLLLHDYAWDAHETGGIYEALRVISLAPGIGSLANGHVARYNVLPNIPTVDEAGLTRDESPGAGAMSHYHNYTFHVQTPVLRVGEEILLNYGVNWFQERQAKLTPTTLQQQQPTSSNTRSPEPSKPTTPSKPALPLLHQQQQQQQQQPPRRSKEWLLEHGLCLDNLRPGPSTITHAGRGAFTTRALPQGSIVAPVPVLPILKRSLEITRLRSKTKSKHSGGADKNTPDMAEDEEEMVHLQQLLLNYCYGHANSSLLLYPYAPLVNFINHASNRSATSNPKQQLKPNVQLQWAAGSNMFHRNDDYLQLTIPQLLAQNFSGLLLQLVASRDLRRGDEVLLDYGDEWQDAWEQHVTTTWRSDTEPYTPSYVMDDVVRNLRTVQEQRHQQPYPNNVFTSCYYRYGDHKQKAEEQFQLQLQEKQNPSISPQHQVIAFRWNATRDLLLDMRYLRPCEVLAREQVAVGTATTTMYTVRMRNRFGLSASERIPTSLMHIVTHVPRFAIRFSDKLYTTDQHLELAFRHAIGMPSEIFPDHWKDHEQ